MYKHICCQREGSESEGRDEGRKGGGGRGRRGERGGRDGEEGSNEGRYEMAVASMILALKAIDDLGVMPQREKLSLFPSVSLGFPLSM